MTDIFLSYSSKDREKVRPVHDALAAMGYAVFWDIETPAGENWDQWIRRHIGKAKVVIVFWTKNSAASLNVQHEAAIAREDNKLIPAQLEFMKAIDFPMGFYTTQAPQLSDWTGMVTHSGYASLMQAVRKRFEGTPAQVAEVARREDEADIVALQRRAEAGDAAAQAELGFRYLRGQGVRADEDEAMRLYRLASDQGNPRGQRGLGYMYSNGLAGMSVDKVGALRLYQAAAAQGDLGAISNLGVMYIKGEAGLIADATKAVELFREAADRGFPEAAYNLARSYMVGSGTDKNDALAVKYFQIAAEHGDPHAQYILGDWHERGLGGLVPDRAEAARWMQLAAEQGYKRAIKALESFGKST